MSIEWLAELAWKSLLLTSVTMALVALASRRSAAEKSVIGDAGLLSLLLLPATLAWLPRIELAAPRALGAAVGRVAPASDAVGAEGSGAASVAAATASSLEWNALVLGLYMLPAIALLTGLACSLFRLRRLQRRARVLEDGRWLSALAAAQNRVGVKHGTALLISDEINSPISWGVVRPVIMIEDRARAEFDRAEAIIAHELAHVQRLDWLKLIIARLVIAIFWFNPLVWVLARRCHQLREEAADDAVLRTRVGTSDYANLLVTAVRHSNARPLFAANGVAPSTSSIGQRVNHVLDSSRPRRPARLKWAAASVVIALSANAALAASDPVLERSFGTDPNAGERAASKLEGMATSQARTIGRAIRLANWEERWAGGTYTIFSEPAAVQPLLEALRDADPVVRKLAVWGLSEMRPTVGDRASAEVAALLGDPSPDVRGLAARTLGDFGSADYSLEISRLLGDPNPAVRVQAAHALGDLQDPATRQALEAALSDPDPGVRSKADWALREVWQAETVLQRYSGG